jgi:hypothetical protein
METVGPDKPLAAATSPTAVVVAWCTGLELRAGGGEAECSRGSGAVSAPRSLSTSAKQLVKALVDAVADAIDHSTQLIGVPPRIENASDDRGERRC